MKVKTSELTGAALDWAVAKCENPEWTDYDALVNVTTFDEYDGTICNYSTDWAQGGPIIERERISIRQWTNVPIAHAYMPQDDAPWASDGISPLVAAMRCYVASKLGDEVEVPDELIKDNQP